MHEKGAVRAVPPGIERFGYPTGQEGDAPDVDQQLIGDIQDVLIIRPRGLA